MIPRIIHYCWFGKKEKPRLAQRCIASWREKLPDYEIREWNEDSFDVTLYPYAVYCLKHHKYAFLSDFVRLLVVHTYGGIYFDTDVEIIRRPDELLKYDAFYGFENDKNVATGLGFGAVQQHISVAKMIEEYEQLRPDIHGDYPMIVCPAVNTKALMQLGLKPNGQRQNVYGAEILPADYFNPYDDPTGRLTITNHTISIHWYGKSWMKKRSIFRSKLTRPFHRIFGVDVFRKH